MSEQGWPPGPPAGRGPASVKGGHGALPCTWHCDPWPGPRQGGASREGAGQGPGGGARGRGRGRGPPGLGGSGLWLCVRSGQGGDSGGFSIRNSLPGRPGGSWLGVLGAPAEAAFPA